MLRNNCTVFLIFVVGLFAQLSYGMDSSVPFINADDVHLQGIAGAGATVAVIDTGIYYGHHGLLGDISPGGASFEYGSREPDPGVDIYGFGHGTYMSLIITDPAGVAPYTNILPVRVFRSNGLAYDVDIVEGIRHVIERRSTVDPTIRVINLSLGGGHYPCNCDLYRPEVAEALADAAAAGIVTFAATGNDAVCGGISSPACVSSAVRVAANYDKQYQGTRFDYPDGSIMCGDFAPPPYWVTCFSNIAENCNYLLAAPGYQINVGGFLSDGTSQATAHASGVAALMFDKSGPCGSLSAYQARDTIFNTARQQWWAYPYCRLPPEPRHVNAIAAVNAVTAGSCGAIAGDLNCDESITPSDFDLLVVCMTGPGNTSGTGGGCACADFPESPPDGDVDLRDFIHFQRAFSGATGTTGTVALNLTSPSAGQTVEPAATVAWSITAIASGEDNAGLAALSVDLVQDQTNRRVVDITPASLYGGAGMEGFIAPEGICNPDIAVGVSGYGGTPLGPSGARNIYQIGGAQNTFGEAGNTGMGTDFAVDASVGQSGPQVIAQGSFTMPLAAGTYVFRLENGLANVLELADPPPSPPASWPIGAAVVDLSAAIFTVDVSHDVIVFDFDDDGDVDQMDFARMQLCLTGAYTLAQLFPDESCDAFDFNQDGRVKEEDILLLGQCASGPGVPASGICGDCNDDGILDVLQSETELGEDPPDGILVLGRPRCTGGNTVDCDDNCPCVYNPDQADSDGNGIGDACEPSPPESPGSGGLLAGGEADESGEGAGDDPLAGLDTTGLATAVSLSVVCNPCPGPYVNSRTEAAGFDGQFVVWTWIEADGDMDGLEYRLRVNGGDDDALFRVVGYAEGPLSVIDPSLDGLGDLFTLYGPPGGFAPGNYLARLAVPVTLDAVGHNELVFNMSAWVAAEAFPGTLLGYVVEPVAPLTEGDYIFTAGGTPATGGEAIWTACPLYGVTSNNQAFTLAIAGE